MSFATAFRLFLTFENRASLFSPSFRYNCDCSLPDRNQVSSVTGTMPSLKRCKLVVCVDHVHCQISLDCENKFKELETKSSLWNDGI